MIRLRSATYLLAVVSIAQTCVPAAAFFHDWNFSEFYSNGNGSVQFIELFTVSPGEVFATGAQIRSMSTGNIFTFDHDLTGSTASKNLLIATFGFESLPGLPKSPPLLTPDFTLPANFFNQAGDTMTLCTAACSMFNVIDTVSFASVPTDGIMSRIYPANSTGTNSPRNLFGTTGSVNPGDYNSDHVVNAADYVVWRNTLTQPASPMGSGADGNANGTIDAPDYDFWKARFGNAVPGAASGATISSVPEPGAIALIGAALCLISFRRAR